MIKIYDLTNNHVNGTILISLVLNLLFFTFLLISKISYIKTVSGCDKVQLPLLIAYLGAFLFLFIIIFLLIKVALDIHDLGKQCKRLVETYLIMGVDINSDEWVRFNSQAMVFATVNLRKTIHLTIFGVKEISYATIGLLVFNLIANPKLFQNIYDYFEENMANSTITISPDFNFTTPIFN